MKLIEYAIKPCRSFTTLIVICPVLCIHEPLELNDALLEDTNNPEESGVSVSTSPDTVMRGLHKA